MDHFTDQDFWNVTVEEARNRLSSGNAEDIIDVVEQLVDEGMIHKNQENEMRSTLEMP
jgi:hypothetical protein